MIKKRFNACAFLTFFALVFLTGSAFSQQVHNEHALLQIQQDFQNGMIDIETAVLSQIQIINDIRESKQNEILKCITPALAFLKQNKDKLSVSTLQQVEIFEESFLRKQKAMQEVFISASGKFEINYETEGIHAVPLEDENVNGIPDYVEWVAEAADSSYRSQVQNIGFRDPIPLTFRYKIYIEEMGFYGFTQTEVGVGPETVIYIENDFENFPTNTDPEGNQKGAIKATMAHEFKHAIQYAQNRWAAPSGAFEWGEMDATLMEEVVFDEVNDYYNYIKTHVKSQNPGLNSIFGAPHRSVPGSYFFVSWMIYYTEVFGMELWKDVWELIEEEHNLPIDVAMIQLMGMEAFQDHFIRNHLWHFASGVRSHESEYGFEEKEQYPIAETERSYRRVPDFSSNLNTINKLAARYYEVSPQEEDEGFVAVAVNFDSTQIGVGLLLYLKSGEIREIITKGEDKAQVYVPTDVNWEEVERIGVAVTNYSLALPSDNLSLEFGKNGSRINIKDPIYAYIPEEIAVFQNYPNPFNNRTKIIFELTEPAFVSLEIYDILGRKVRTLVSENRIFGRYEEDFNASGLASGIYLYRIQIGNEIFIKKMTLTK